MKAIICLQGNNSEARAQKELTADHRYLELRREKNLFPPDARSEIFHTDRILFQLNDAGDGVELYTSGGHIEGWMFHLVQYNGRSLNQRTSQERKVEWKEIGTHLGLLIVDKYPFAVSITLMA